MKQALLGISILALAFTANAQSGVLSKIPATGKSVFSFIPKGYDTLQGGITYGDLDKDGQPDAVIALYNKKEDTIDVGSELKRLLIVLLKTADGYRVVSKSTGAVLCKGCGGAFGDPFSDITITKGILQVDHYGGSAWRWTIKDKYRYQNNDMYLIGTTNDSYWDGSGCNGGVGSSGRTFKDVNWVTGDQEEIERNTDCKLLKHTKTKIKVKPLVKMAAVTHNT